MPKKNEYETVGTSATPDAVATEIPENCPDDESTQDNAEADSEQGDQPIAADPPESLDPQESLGPQPNAKPPEKKKRAAPKKKPPESESEPESEREHEQEPGPGAAEPGSDDGATAHIATRKPKAPARKKGILDLDLNALDKGLSTDERKEWSAIYASYRSKSLLAGTVIGMDTNTINVINPETRQAETAMLNSLIIVGYRVKVLIPETEMWAPGTERPAHVLRSMVGAQLDYVIMEIDREGGCAIGSRRMALVAKRHFFSRMMDGVQENQLLKCRVVITGAKRCTVECNGYDIPLSQRELSYAAIADLREKYRPGLELDCLFRSYDTENDRLYISVKEAGPNPFDGAEVRHPVGSRRQATISGKYAGGVFCTLPDDTVCLCLYSTRHSDLDFEIGNSVIVAIRQYDHGRRLIYGRILTKWG